jgi:hypothetical protein
MFCCLPPRAQGAQTLTGGVNSRCASAKPPENVILISLEKALKKLEKRLNKG